MSYVKNENSLNVANEDCIENVEDRSTTIAPTEARISGETSHNQLRICGSMRILYLHRDKKW